MEAMIASGNGAIGASPAVLQAEKEGEVRLRRTIGLKKDEYYLNKKHVT